MNEQHEKFRKRKTTATDILAEQGKLPPQAIDFEEVVLGALMIEKDSILSLPDTLKAECFYKESHQRIFTAIKRLFNNSNPVDILTVTNELRKSGELEDCGGAYAITQLTNRVSSGLNIEYHSQIIIEKYLQREIIRLSSENIREAYSEETDALELLDKFNLNALNLNNFLLNGKSTGISDVCDTVMKRIVDVADGKTTFGIPTGLCIDELTGGLSKSDFTVIAARPGMGKTAMLLTIILKLLRDGKPCGLFSLEMSKEQIILRLLSMIAEVPHFLFKTPAKIEQYQWVRLNEANIYLQSLPLQIDDTAGISIQQIRSRTIRWISEYGIELMAADYIQKISCGDIGKGRSRENEVSAVARGLKNTAKECNIPVLSPSQFNRDFTKTNRKPGLSDLRESGDIENEADEVIILYRPVVAEQGQNIVDTEVIVEKNRHGATGFRVLDLHQHLVTFKNQIVNEYGQPLNDVNSKEKF